MKPPTIYVDQELSVVGELPEATVKPPINLSSNAHENGTARRAAVLDETGKRGAARRSPLLTLRQFSVVRARHIERGGEDDDGPLTRVCPFRFASPGLSIVLAQARCAFHEKRLDLGVMPVGLEKEVYATLHNAGKCPAVAYVELPNENAGVRVEPSRCRIPVGGSQKLRITAQPAVPRQFDGLSLLANVRGAKTLRLPIAGVAVVPDVVLAMAAHFPDMPPPECDPDTGAPPPPAESFEFGEQRARLWTRASSNGWLPRVVDTTSPSECIKKTPCQSE